MIPVNPNTVVGNITLQPEGLPESAKFTPVADAGVFEVQEITFPAVAAMAQGDYAIIKNKANTTFALWMDIDANGVAPTGAAYVASSVKIKLGVATGDTAAQVATKVIAALTTAGTLVDLVHAAGSTTAKVKFTSTKLGDVAAPAIHNKGDTGDGSLLVGTVVVGVASSLQNKYITFNKTGTAYAAWLNVNSEGVDPTVALKTMVPVAVVGGATIAQICTAAANAIEALAGVNAKNSVTHFVVATDAAGDVTSATAGDSGFTVEILRQGKAETFSPSFATGSINIDPAAY
jgi:hypothetical protein